MLIEENGTAAGAGAEPQATDSTDRTAAALEAWNASAETKTDDAGAVGAGGGEGADADTDAKAKADADAKAKTDADAAKAKADADAKAAGDDITKAPFFADPVFKKFYEGAQANAGLVNEFQQMFSNGRYQIKDMETLKNVHEDAFLLYDIADGKKSVGELLDLFSKNWKPEQFKAVLQDIANYAANKDVAGKKGEPNPLESRLSALEKERADGAARDAEQKKVAAQMKVVVALESEIKRLCADAGIKAADKATKEDIAAIDAETQDYIFWISDELGRNPELVKQLEKGQYGEAQRLFSERHNVMLARAKRYNDGKVAEFDKKQKETPRQAAAGAAPADAKTRKVNVRDGEARRAAALSQLTVKN